MNKIQGHTLHSVSDFVHSRLFRGYLFSSLIFRGYVFCFVILNKRLKFSVFIAVKDERLKQVQAVLRH